MRVFIRLDVSPDIGLGHLRRCNTLSESLIELGIKPVFLIRSTSRELIDKQLSGDRELVEIPWDIQEEEDVDYLIKWCRENNVNCGVIDHYRQTVTGQRQLIDAGIEWLQFANPILNQPLGGALLYDATPGNSLEDYDSRRFIRTGGEFLCGPSYSLISPSITKWRELALPWLERTQTLITFGGGNDRGAIKQILDLLEEVAWPGKKVVLTTSLNPSLRYLERLSRADPEIDLVVDNWSPGQLMAASRVAFCAGGTTLFELAALGVPVIITTIAKNQEAQAFHWEARGLGVTLGMLKNMDRSIAVSKLQDLLKSPDSLREMSQRGSELVDGDGALRTARKVLEMANR